MKAVFILINIVFTTIAQILLKFSAVKNNLFLLAGGYFLFVLVVIDSYFLMKLIDFKYFTAIMSTNYLTVFIASTIIFRESINKTKTLGVVLVAAGVIIFSI